MTALDGGTYDSSHLPGETRPTNRSLPGLAGVILLLLGACLGLADPERVSPDELIDRIKASRHNSAERWWYAGEENGRHVFVRELGLDFEAFSVATSEMLVPREIQMSYSPRRADWRIFNYSKLIARPSAPRTQE